MTQQPTGGYLLRSERCCVGSRAAHRILLRRYTHTSNRNRQLVLHLCVCHLYFIQVLTPQQQEKAQDVSQIYPWVSGTLCQAALSEYIALERALYLQSEVQLCWEHALSLL